MRAIAVWAIGATGAILTVIIGLAFPVVRALSADLGEIKMSTGKTAVSVASLDRRTSLLEAGYLDIIQTLGGMDRDNGRVRRVR